VFGRKTLTANLAKTISSTASDLWILMLSITITEFQPGKGFILLRRASTNELKVSAV